MFKNDSKNSAVKISDVFGTYVFNDRVMRERLPKETYKILKKTIDNGETLDPKIAEIVANAMKDWAIEKGATHYTHWFQPLNGITAEKHESFINPTSDGSVVMEFSGKMLVKGESDASSFPSGGLRATFEARGYTSWDCTSPAFLKEDISGVTLCIPTAFCSFTGEALDEKTPLLRSMEALNKHVLRILRLFGNNTSKRIYTMVGAEQEYFLVDRELFNRRKDLVFTGRTLFGGMPLKGQEMEDHYYGSIKERVSKYMKDLDIELWKMGVTAKTKHNEVAPAQHELAPVYCSANIAADHNQLIMETMKRVANRHSLACLLHEKPFSYINGSGKHNNWSLSTDDGINLLDPGKNPRENAQFLIFLCAVIRAVDKHAKLLRLSASSYSNDYRLGGCEAPPAVISMFLGTELSDVLNQISHDENNEAGKRKKMEFGVPSLPKFYLDTTDRNRTSPFAFTGNKFEFRMLGSSMPIAMTNTILNTIVAASLDDIASRLEKAEDFDDEVNGILKDIIKKHGRIIFDGNGYSDEWAREAEKRGLPNVTNTVDAAEAVIGEQTVKVFEDYNIYTKSELEARYEIYLETYTKQVMLEARTMCDMATREILTACIKYTDNLANTIIAIEKVGMPTTIQRKKLQNTIELINDMTKASDVLKQKYALCEDIEDIKQKTVCARDELLPAMQTLREPCDKLEKIIDKKLWPFPTYTELLFDI